MLTLLLMTATSSWAITRSGALAMSCRCRRWDHDPKLAELGWEPPVKIRTRNYRRRRPLEKFKVALRNFGITALRGAARLTGARPPRDDGQRE